MIALYILLAIVVLLFMVLIHEFGHYVVGKLLKFKITEFSVGFGFPIFSKRSKKTGEKFSFRIFPLGGYCSFYGEDDDGDAANPEAFNNQKPWKRILVFFAGVTFNFLTAIIFSWILLCTTGYDVKEIARYNPDYANNFQVGDVITHINGTKVDFAFGENLIPMIENQKSQAEKVYKEYYETHENSFEGLENRTFLMTVKRNGKSQTFEVTLYPDTIKGTDGKVVIVAMTGLESGSNEPSCLKTYVYNAWEGFCRSFEVAFGFAWVVLKSLWMLITFQIPITQVGGTISTIAEMATLTSQNAANMLVFIPLIAANLAVFNILPFPALDGSHVVFTLIEWIRGKPINRKVENAIHLAGICILLGFVIIVDILHFVL